MYDLRDGIALLMALVAVVTLFVPAVGLQGLGVFCGGILAGLLLTRWLEVAHDWA